MIFIVKVKHLNTYILSILSIIISVVGISISYLSLSSYLNINGATTPELVGWNLYFDDIAGIYTEGNAQELSRPFIENESTCIKNFNISFNNVGDSISYIVNMVNGGTIDSKISSIEYSKPVCYGSGKNATEDAKMVCNNIKLELMYASGEEIRIGDVLSKNSRQNFKITIKYTGDKMPKNTVEIKNLSMTIIYVQK